STRPARVAGARANRGPHIQDDLPAPVAPTTKVCNHTGNPKAAPVASRPTGTSDTARAVVSSGRAAGKAWSRGSPKDHTISQPVTARLGTIRIRSAPILDRSASLALST